MNLKILNIVVVALLALAYQNPTGKCKWRLVALCALIDSVILWTLMAERGAVDTAGELVMTQIRITHITSSALFPLFYPYLLLDDSLVQETKSKVPRWLFHGFLVLRGISFWTSYFMVN